MPHIIEQAPTGRAKCRGCEGKIAAKEWRFGESLPNPFAEGEGMMTHWFHLQCAAFRRPEPVLETIASPDVTVPDKERLERAAQAGVTHRRLPRISTTERASTARAACRHCKEKIEKDAWRIALLYYEDGRFSPSGFVHLQCAGAYFETTDIMDRIQHFSPALTPAELDEIKGQLKDSRDS